MTIQTQIIPATPPALSVRSKRFSVLEYQRMIATGIIRSGEKLELREGWLVYKMTVNPPHAASIRRTVRVLTKLLPKGWCQQAQLPISLLDSVPEPDIAILRGVEEDYDKRHPTAADSPQVTEVADSSLDEDRVDAARMYARAKIPVYWIINIPEEQIEVYTDPTGDCDEPAYRSRRDYHRGEDVPLILDGVEVARIPVNELLP